MKLKIIRPNTVIHCKTREESECLLNELHKSGIKWRSGGSLEKYKFDEDSPLGTGYWLSKDMGLEWAEISYFMNRTVEYGEIIPFSSLIIEEKTYEDGLNEAWAAAKKIVLRKEHGGLPLLDLERIFEREPEWEVEYSVFKNLTPQEVIAKLESYEEEKQIKVGDVVNVINNESYNSETGIFLGEDYKHYWVLLPNYSVPQSLGVSRYTLKKTGKHIDLSSILAEIGKE